MNKENCELYIMIGNCPQKQSCKKFHPKLKPIKKSKLKYNKQIFHQTSQKKNTQFQNCTCCKGNPQACTNSTICQQINKCTCIATQSELESGYNNICDCCFGNFQDCLSPLCEQLGMCQCQLHKNIEQNHQQMNDGYFEQNKNCKCCKGNVFNCQGENCNSHCYCFN